MSLLKSRQGPLVKLSWLKHFGYNSLQAVSYTYFVQLVAREITGKAGSRDGRTTGKAALPQKAPAFDLPGPAFQPNLQTIRSQEKQE